MSKAKSTTEDLISPTGGAVAGGVAGGLMGAVVAGPLGIIPGAAVGAVSGVLAGKRAEEELKPRILYPEGDLEHFQAILERLPYHVPGMDWNDYEPAYRFAIMEYQKLDEYRNLEDLEPELAQAWETARGSSRLSWAGARPAVAHLWEAYDSGTDPMGDIQPAANL